MALPASWNTFVELIILANCAKFAQNSWQLQRNLNEIILGNYTLYNCRIETTLKDLKQIVCVFHIENIWLERIEIHLCQFVLKQQCATTSLQSQRLILWKWKKIFFRQKWYQLSFPRVWLGTFYAPLRRPSTTSVWNKAPSWISGRIEFHPSISSNTDLEHYKMSNSCKRKGSVPCSVIVLHVFRKKREQIFFS